MLISSSRFMAAIACLLALTDVATAQHHMHGKDMHSEEYHADYIFGSPDDPSEAWVISRGGRLYDNWYATQGLDATDQTHASWPADNSKTGAATTRCKSCHGWDYRGADGRYGSGSYQTGIAGVMGWSGSAKDLENVLHGETHRYSDQMIPHEQTEYLAAFLTMGLDDMNSFINFETGEVMGDADNGAGIFQTTCAACHGFDGRSLDWGDRDEPGYVGTEAMANPWEVLHKIRNGHPGVEMISLRAFDLKDSADLLAYTRTLPVK